MEEKKNDTPQENEDEIKEMFTRALERQDEEDIIKEENEEKVVDTHHAEIFAPIAVAIFLVICLFGDPYKLYTLLMAYLALASGVIGIYVCKKKGSRLTKSILLINVIAVGLAFFASAMTTVLVASLNMK